MHPHPSPVRPIPGSCQSVCEANPEPQTARYLPRTPGAHRHVARPSTRVPRQTLMPHRTPLPGPGRASATKHASAWPAHPRSKPPVRAGLRTMPQRGTTAPPGHSARVVRPSRDRHRSTTRLRGSEPRTGSPASPGSCVPFLPRHRQAHPHATTCTPHPTSAAQSRPADARASLPDPSPSAPPDAWPPSRRHAGPCAGTSSICHQRSRRPPVRLPTPDPPARGSAWRGRRRSRSKPVVATRPASTGCPTTSARPTGTHG